MLKKINRLLSALFSITLAVCLTAMLFFPNARAKAAGSALSLPNAAQIVGGSNLIDQAQANRLAGYLREGNVTFTNIFSKTAGDGKTAAQFHAAADYQGRTITVYKVQYGGNQYLIGGYNPQSWSGGNNYNYSTNDVDRKAFLFNLTSNFIQRQKPTFDPACSNCGYYQTYNHQSYGPTFGAGHDLYVDGSLQSGYVYNYGYGTTYNTNNILNIGVGNNSQGISILGLEVFKVTNDANGAQLNGGQNLINQAQANQIGGYLNEGGVVLTNIFSKTAGDGKTSANFHSTVDGRGRTITVYKVQYNGNQYLIGGYNPQSWNSFNGWNYTSIDVEHSAFLFNLTSNFLQRQKNYYDPACGGCGYYQTYNGSGYGPTFGGGHDIYVDNTLQSGYVFNYGYGTTYNTNNILNIGVGNNSQGISILAFDVFKVEKTVNAQNAAQIIGGSNLINQSKANEIAGVFNEGRISLSKIFEKTTGDGKTSTNFHSAVDGRGRTLTVYRVQHNSIEYLLAAYNPQSWHSSEGYNQTINDTHKTAFLYNFNSSFLQRQKQNGESIECNNCGQSQTYNGSGYGPYFGSGDLGVSSSLQSGSSINYSYGSTYNTNNILNINLANNQPITVLGFEVFKVAESIVIANNQSVSTDEDTPLEIDLTGENPGGGSLTFNITTQPAHGTISVSDADVTYTPAANYYGADSFQFTASDDSAVSSPATVSITINPVNDAPVLNAIQVQNGVWGNPVTFTASATDIDSPANQLAFSLVNAPSNASIDSASGIVSWTPSSANIGQQSFDVRVSDALAPQLFSQQTVTINVGKRSAAVVYGGASSQQYSDQAQFSALLRDASGGYLNDTPIANQTINFNLGTQSVSAATGENGAAAANLALTQAPGNYQIATSFAENALYLPATDSDAFTIAPEDARAFYNGAFYKATASSSASSALVTLSATVKDISAVDNNDSSAGNIANAVVDFINREDGSVLAANVAVSLAGNDPTTGVAVATVPLNINSLNAQTISVGVAVKGFYARNAAEENALVTVAKPISTNFVSGGGGLTMQNSAGQAAGTIGSAVDFGLNVRHGTNGSNPQGDFTVIVRSGGSVYQIRGNSIGIFSVNNSNPLARTANLNAAGASITNITDWQNPISVSNTALVQIRLSDKGEPGAADSISIQITDNNQLWFSSNWNNSQTVEQTLGTNAGNLVFRYVSSPR